MIENLKNDWRYTGQDSYLKHVTLKKCVFNGKSSDHEHCEFCFARFGQSDQDLHIGYSTLDAYHWICPACFEDFSDEFGWRVLDTTEADPLVSET